MYWYKNYNRLRDTPDLFISVLLERGKFPLYAPGVCNDTSGSLTWVETLLARSRLEHAHIVSYPGIEEELSFGLGLRKLWD
jgi:hypothetical protein